MNWIYGQQIYIFNRILCVGTWDQGGFVHWLFEKFILINNGKLSITQLLALRFNMPHYSKGRLHKQSRNLTVFYEPKQFIQRKYKNKMELHLIKFDLNSIISK